MNWENGIRQYKIANVSAVHEVEINQIAEKLGAGRRSRDPYFQETL